MRNSMHRSRFGLTSVDVIIGLVCVVMLASLALPYLLHTRSTMRSRVCKNRIRQLDLAGHNYHDANKRMPPATLGYAESVDAEAWSEDKESNVYWKHAQNTSSILIVAPYMELIDHYNKFNPVAMNTYRNLRDHNNEFPDSQVEWQGDLFEDSSAIEAQLADLKCPEDKLGDEELRTVIATQPSMQFESEDMGDVDASRDIAIQLWPDEDLQLGTTNFIACMGADVGKSYAGDENKQYRGAMTSRSKVTLETIRDGTSRTLMYGESLGRIRDGERTAAMSWTWGGGGRINGLVPADLGTHPDDENIKIFGDKSYSSVVGFGSNHDGVVNFGFCDGSVHEIKIDIDKETLLQLAGADDGGVPLDF